MPISAILFDKDGTLFEFGNTWEAWANSVLLRLTGRDTARATEVGRHIGFDMVARRFHPDSIVIDSSPSATPLQNSVRSGKKAAQVRLKLTLP